MRRWIFALAALAVAGLVLVLAAGDTALDAIGVGLTGVAVVGGVSLGFYAVGRSEDRAREADARAREPGARNGAADAERPGDGRITSRRPPRSRGDS
jgi:small neutral amino acid transporter SnatA (MarC family)